MRVVVVLFFSLAFVSCSIAIDSGQTRMKPGPGGAQISLDVLGESIYESGDFSLTVAEHPHGIAATVVGRSVVNLKALYIELSYDSKTLGLRESAGSPFLADLGQVLELGASVSTGVHQHGQVMANWPERNGFTGDGVMASFLFEVRAADVAADSPKYVAAVPASDRAAHWLNFNAKSSVFLWYYVNPGDYDQNGEVGISDLTPLGASFNDEGPFAVTDARSVIDGDGNSAINIADITPIGQNFGNHIDSYTVYGSSDSVDYPSGNTAPNGPGAQEIGTRQFAAGKGGGTLRKYWEQVMDAPILGGRYWVRPASIGDEGTPSQLLTSAQPQWHLNETLGYEPQGETVIAKCLSVATIQDRPAAIFVTEINGGERDFLYLQAEDSFGDSWRSPVVVLSKDDAFGNPSLAEVGGNPAFTMMSDLSDGAMLFYRAANEEGTVWSLPVTVDTKTNPGIRSRLMVYGGVPVVVFTNGGDEAYIRIALDAQGGAWGDAQLFHSQALVDLLDAMVTPTGVAAILVDYVDNYSVHYFRLDISGSVAAVYPGVELMPSDAGGTYSLNIDIAGGNPYAVAARGLSSELVYTSALDENGASWSSAVSLPLPDGSAQVDVKTVHGVPWVVYYTSADQIIRSARAAEPGSITWSEEAHVAEAALGPKFISILTAGIHPALVYADDIEKKLIYGIFY